MGSQAQSRSIGIGMIIVGALLYWIPGVGPFLQGIGYAMMVGGALNVVGTLIAPRPSGSGGIKNSPTYGSGARSVAAEGAPKKINLGAQRTRPEIVSVKTVGTGDSETVFMLLHVGTGGDYGIESISEVELNNTPISRFPDTEVQTRLGTSGQSVMKGFDTTSIAYPVNQEIGNSSYVYETVGEVDEVSIVLAWYAGLAQISKSGIGATTWMAQVEYQDEGSDTWVNINAPSGVEDGWGTLLGGGLGWVATAGAVSVVRRTMRLEFPSLKARTIRITTFKSWTTTKLRRTATVVRVEEGTDDGNAYAGEALLGLKYVTSGQLSGGLPKVTALIKGWRVKNMGDSVYAWTQNPAKLWLAVMTDEVNGCGRYTPLSMFDDGVGGTWRAARDSFDEQVTVTTELGKTRIEDRVHLDLTIDTMETAADWIEHFERLTRSTIVDWGEEGIRLLVDEAGSSVATFDGRQDRSSSNRPILMKEDGTVDLVEIETPTDKRTTHIRAVYWDEDDGYARRFTDELVDPDYVDGDPRVTVELFLPGVTRQSQALRECRYRLNVDRLRPIAYEYGVGIGDLDLLPMDIATLYVDSPALDGVKVVVIGTAYGPNHDGRIACVKYDAAVYADTSDVLQKKAPSLSHAKALKQANRIPAGVSNVKLSEVVGSTHLRIDWDVVPDANRRYLRVYRSSTEALKGMLEAEVDPDEQAYLIRNVEEGAVSIRILAVSRAGTEEDWRVGAGHAKILVTRQKIKPSDLLQVAAQNVAAPLKRAIAVKPPDKDDPPQKIEIIKGPDEYRGQLVGTQAVERTGTTGEQGQRTQGVDLPSQPGRLTGGGDESIVVRAITEGGKAPGAATTVSVPFLNMPNHSPTVLASIIGTARVGFDAPASTDAWELDATDGVRLKKVPAKQDATAANGWGNKGTGLLADHPAGAKYLIAATITSNELDLGAVKTFVLECYDEAQRKTAAASIPKWRATFPKSPVMDPGLEDYDGGPDWAARLLDKSMRPLRPLAATFWEYRIKDTSPVDGDWAPVAIGALVRGRYVEVRFTVTDLLGHFQVISPRAYVRAWVPIDSRTITRDGSDFGAGDLAQLDAGGLQEIGVRVDSGNESLQVNIGGVIFTTSVT